MPDRDLTDALIEIVRERIEQEQLSVNRLAQLAEMPQPTLFKYLKGGGTPTVDVFEALAGPLRTTLEELLAAARKRV